MHQQEENQIEETIGYCQAKIQWLQDECFKQQKPYLDMLVSIEQMQLRDSIILTKEEYDRLFLKNT